MGEWFGVLLAIVSSSLGGTAAAVTRYLVGNADPLTLAILRWGIGLCVVLPVAFWWLSIAGAAVSLVALANMDRPSPVLLLAQACGLLIYGRNLALHRRGPGVAA